MNMKINFPELGKRAEVTLQQIANGIGGFLKGIFSVSARIGHYIRLYSGKLWHFTVQLAIITIALMLIRQQFPTEFDNIFNTIVEYCSNGIDAIGQSFQDWLGTIKGIVG